MTFYHQLLSATNRQHRAILTWPCQVPTRNAADVPQSPRGVERFEEDALPGDGELRTVGRERKSVPKAGLAHDNRSCDLGLTHVPDRDFTFN